MAKIKCKGTAIAQKLADVYTTVAQVISLELPEAESETYESDTLDNTDAGIPYDQTGRSEGGSCSLEFFYDPALAGHKALTELIRVPQDEDWRITFADAGESTWTFTGAGFSLGGTVALNSGLKGSAKIKLDGIPTYPSGGSAA
jgi:hypothetical protein